MFATFNSSTDKDYFENVLLILNCFVIISCFMFVGNKFSNNIVYCL